MTDHPSHILTVACAVGSGVIGGAFFAFSTFVMRALGRLPVAQGIAAMQSINVVVLNPWFLSVFVGTALGCGVLSVISLIGWSSADSSYLLAGGAWYIGGTFLVTLVCNVPWNNALAAVDPTGSDAAKLWKDYLSMWTAWNHVRTVAALVSTVLLIRAL